MPNLTATVESTPQLHNFTLWDSWSFSSVIREKASSAAPFGRHLRFCCSHLFLESGNCLVQTRWQKSDYSNGPSSHCGDEECLIWQGTAYWPLASDLFCSEGYNMFHASTAPRNQILHLPLSHETLLMWKTNYLSTVETGDLYFQKHLKAPVQSVDPKVPLSLEIYVTITLGAGGKGWLWVWVVHSKTWWDHMRSITPRRDFTEDSHSISEINHSCFFPLRRPTGQLSLHLLQMSSGWQLTSMNLTAVHLSCQKSRGTRSNWSHVVDAISME